MKAIRSGGLGSLTRSVVPKPLRRFLRRWVEEIPHRARDLVPDLVDALGPRRGAPGLPPARLRRGVGRTCSRHEFLDVGRKAANELLSVVEQCAAMPSLEHPRRWLDFGCGCGRVAYHLVSLPGMALHGVDVDGVAVRWARRHLAPGAFAAVGARPPFPFPDGHFDLVYAISVFTHFDEATQERWLAELVRVLCPGGLLVASTHNESLVWSRPDLTGADTTRLTERGFLFAPGGGPFNENSTFHTHEYLERVWGRTLEPVSFARLGLGGYQDLGVWRRPGLERMGTTAPSSEEK